MIEVNSNSNKHGGQTLPAEKFCTRCEQVKSLELFNKQLRGKFGRNSWCKACQREKLLETACSITLAEKKCTCCKAVKPAADFMVSKTAIHGLQGRCRECMRWEKIKINFGLSRQDYETMLVNQNGVCAICKTPKSEILSVDHSHKTGKVRGLLCNACNTSIGMLNDSPEILKSAIVYLHRHEN